MAEQIQRGLAIIDSPQIQTMCMASKAWEVKAHQNGAGQYWAGLRGAAVEIVMVADPVRSFPNFVEFAQARHDDPCG